MTREPENFDLSVRNDILDVAQMLPALRARLLPGRGVGEKVGKRRKGESQLPIDVGVSDLLRDVRWAAQHFAHVLMDEVHDYSPTGETDDALLRDIAGRIGHWTQDDDRTALDFSDTWHELRRKVAGAISQREKPKWLGPCLVEECTGDLYLRTGKIDARCDDCGRECGMGEIREYLTAAFEDRLMTRGELITAIYVVTHVVTKSNTLNHWIQRGRLVAVMDDPDLYRFAEALELAERKVA